MTSRLADAPPVDIEREAGAQTTGSKTDSNTLQHPAPHNQPLPIDRPQMKAATSKARGLLWDVCFIATVISGQMMTQAQLGTVMIPGEQIGAWLGTDDHGEWSWFAASYTLTLGLFVLVGGALGDILSPKVCFIFGYALMAILNIASGFCRSFIPFDICRGLCGIGGALVAPNGAALLGKQYPAHSTRRTIGFGVLGALAPIGFTCGGVLSGLIGTRAGFEWSFFVTAIACAFFAVLGCIVLPSGGGDPSMRFDWLGAIFGVSGMILFNFSWNQGPLVGWETPYIYGLFVVGLLLLVAFVAWESRMGEKALVPLSIFTKEVLLVLLALWWGWSSFGAFLFYTISFIRDIRGFHDPLVISAQMATIAPVGAIAALLVIWLFPRMKGHWILSIALFAFFVGNLLMSLAPVKQTFWAQIFPAEAICVFGPDLSYASGALIIANSVGPELQGVAAGLTLLTINYSMSIGLGFAGTVERYVGQGDRLKGYRAAFYFATCLAFLGFLLVVTFVRTGEGQARSEEKVDTPSAQQVGGD